MLEKTMLFIFLVGLIGLPWQIQGLDFYKSPEFVAGNLTFSWNPHSEDFKYYDVLITRNTTPDNWTRTRDTKFTIGDAMLYESIKIKVRIGRSNGHKDNEMEYRVNKIKTKIGDTVNISWTAPFFPTAGQYYVYHTCRENRTLFSISSSGVSYGGDAVSTKFTYLTRPFDSKTITFEIKGITLDDAGYYNGGPLVKVACSGEVSS